MPYQPLPDSFLLLSKATSNKFFHKAHRYKHVTTVFDIQGLIDKHDTHLFRSIAYPDHCLYTNSIVQWISGTEDTNTHLVTSEPPSLRIPSSIHRVSKNKQNYFCYNYVKLSPNLTIFGAMMANCLKLYEVHSFSTSPNLCQCTTMLNADVPNCYITL